LIFKNKARIIIKKEKQIQKERKKQKIKMKIRNTVIIKKVELK